MFTRVVRFTDVDENRMTEMLRRIETSDGPPPGAPATGLHVMFDEGQRTAIVLQHFATENDMKAGDRVFGEMQVSDTPGSRASVDMCEDRLELATP